MTLTTTLIILWFGCPDAFAWSVFELRKQARDDVPPVTDLTEEQAQRRLDEIARELER